MGIADTLLVIRCHWKWWESILDDLKQHSPLDPSVTQVVTFLHIAEASLAHRVEDLFNAEILQNSIPSSEVRELCAIWDVDVSFDFTLPSEPTECTRLFDFLRHSLLFMVTKSLVPYCADSTRLLFVRELLANCIDEPVLLAAAAKDFQTELSSLPYVPQVKQLASSLMAALPEPRPKCQPVVVDLNSIFLDAQQRIALAYIDAVKAGSIHTVTRIDSIIDDLLYFSGSSEIGAGPQMDLVSISRSCNLASLLSVVCGRPHEVGTIGASPFTFSEIPGYGRRGSTCLFILWLSSPDLVLFEFSSDDLKRYQSDPLAFSCAHFDSNQPSRLSRRWERYRDSQVRWIETQLRQEASAAVLAQIAVAGIAFLVGAAATAPIPSLPPPVIAGVAAMIGYLLGRPWRK